MATQRYSSDPRERARQLIQEGKIGGARPGAGRPRKHTADGQRKRAAAVMAEGISEMGPQMLKVIRDVLADDEASDTLKLRAIKAAVGIEGAETDRAVDELRDPSSARSQELAESAESAEEARERLAEMLTHPVSGQRLRDALAGVLSTAAPE